MTPETIQPIDTEEVTSWKEESIEIVWSEENEEYIVSKGAVELGYFGKFSVDQMEIEFDEDDYEDLFSEEEEDEYEDLKNYLSENMDHEEIAKGLTQYFNHRLADIKKHIIEINQAFLAYLMDDISGCGYPFWERCTSYVIPDKMPAEGDYMENAIYTEEVTEEIEELFDKYYETAMNGKIDTTTYVEDFLEQKLPMFDYKKLLKDVYSEDLYLGVNGISVQCSGAGESLELVCAAYVVIQNDNSFYDWHNH